MSDRVLPLRLFPSVIRVVGGDVVVDLLKCHSLLRTALDGHGDESIVRVGRAFG